MDVEDPVSGVRSARLRSRMHLEERADLETDDGSILTEKGLGRELLKDWDLELDERRHHTQRGIAAGRKTPKLVHNIVFSMPRGREPLSSMIRILNP